MTPDDLDAPMTADCSSDRPPVVIVTGAGSGIGRALTRSLVAEGYDVVLVGRRVDRLDATAATCTGPGRWHTIPADVTSPCAPEAIVVETLATFGRIDAVVNNAGLARFASLDDMADGDAHRMLATNLVAPAALIRAATPHLRRQQGCVVNVGSIGGLLALPDRAFYGASKAALHHLTRSLARELAPSVRVNAVVPGVVDTEMHEDLGLSPDETQQLREDLVRTTPLGRMGTAEDIVPWIALLLGPAGRWMTGSLVVVDGGRSC